MRPENDFFLYLPSHRLRKKDKTDRLKKMSFVEVKEAGKKGGRKKGERAEWED